jgi:hypothetical protein
VFLDISFTNSILVTIDDTDPNEWLNMFNSPGMIIFQVILGATNFATLILACYKFYLTVVSSYAIERSPLVTPRSQGNLLVRCFMNMPNVFVTLAMVMTTCGLCLIYLMVDPISSRGIYTKPVETYFDTLPLPPTFLGTFMMTLTLGVTIQQDNLTVAKRFGALKKIVAIYVAFGVLSFVIEIALDVARARTDSLAGQFTRGITVVYYVVAALSIVIFYSWVYWRALKVLGGFSRSRDQSSDSSILPKLHRLLARNLWVISSLYVAWIAITVALAVTELSPNQTPTSKACLDFFFYFVVMLISLFHVLVLKPSQTHTASLPLPEENSIDVSLPSVEENSEPASQ